MSKLSSTWSTFKVAKKTGAPAPGPRGSPDADRDDLDDHRSHDMTAAPPNATTATAIPALTLDPALPSLSAPALPLASSSSTSSASAAARMSPSRPLALLRVQILQARDLVAKDRGNTSDPFVVFSVPGTAAAAATNGGTAGSKRNYRRLTPVIPKQLNPKWRPEDTTYELEVTPEWFGGAWPDVAASVNAHQNGSSDRSAPVSVDEEATPVALRPRRPSEGAANTTALLSTGAAASSSSSPAAGLASRPATRRTISGTAGRLLAAPVRMGARGAIAGAKAVRRRRRGGNDAPRPLRLRNHVGGGGASRTPPKGSAQLNPQGLLSGSTVGALEFVIWDKDKLTQDDYMGEASLRVDEWVPLGRPADWDHSEPVWLRLVSTRRHAKVSGELQVRVGLVALGDTTSGNLDKPGSATLSIDELYAHLVAANQQGGHAAGIRSVPADKSVGTAAAFIDDGLSSGSEEEEMEELLSEDGEGGDDGGDDGDDVDDSPRGVGEDSDTTDFTGTETEEEMFEAYYRSVAGVPHPRGNEAVGTNAEDEEDADMAAGAAAAISRSRVRAKISSEPEEMDQEWQICSPAAPLPVTESSGTAAATADGGVSTRRRLWRRKKTRDSSSGGAQSSLDVASDGAGIGSKHEPADMGLVDVPAESEMPRRRRRRRLAKGEKADGALGQGGRAPRVRRRRLRKVQDFAYKVEQGIDIIGLVQMEVKGARDLPRWKNNLGTSFDMDAFCIAAFGTKVFRTRVIRHSLNPTWDEKLIFHVRRHEANFLVKLAVYDWDSLSYNDYVGGADLRISELVEAAPKPDPNTGLYAPTASSGNEMHTFTLKLGRAENDEPAKFDKHHPTLTVEAKYTPYAALRQRFWRQLLLQYDTNDSGTLSVIELSSMLDTLGSTLTSRTLEGFFARFGKRGDVDELTFDEAVIALEEEIQKPMSEKRLASDGTSTPALASGMQTPALADVTTSNPLDLSALTAPLASTANRDGGESHDAPLKPVRRGAESKSRVVERDSSGMSLGSTTQSSVDGGEARSGMRRRRRQDASSDGAGGRDDGSVERLIVLKSCPLCHLPRLSHKAEVDIVTHLAVCASSDWRRVDAMMVSNFVTASQAQRKWYAKMITKISQGQYRLGADSANIIVQDRATGELLEEKMQVYVRLGIRLMYRGMNSRMEGPRIKRMLRDMSVKQGAKFDSPTSAREIGPFIAFHNLKVDEILEPLDSFKTFNEFFYRKLKPGVRPVEEPENPCRIVSAADCRMTAFQTIEESTTVWIKGKDFSVAKLLGDAPARNKMASLEKYRGGSLCIFRLAPQDYHRFHSPVDATVGEPTWIEGQYYTVNPMAIHSHLDVYGHNIRVVVPLKTELFGTVFYVCIGAMMVGSTRLTVKPGDALSRGDEVGYFAFGGSTILCLFERGRVELDDDVARNSQGAIETLVRVGMGIARAVGPSSTKGGAATGTTTPAAASVVAAAAAS